jgi:hypothetical protein
MASIIKVDELAGKSNTEIIIPQNTRLVAKDQIVRTYYKESTSAYTYGAGRVNGSLGFVDTDLELTVKQTIPGTKFLIDYRAHVDIPLGGGVTAQVSQSRIIRVSNHTIASGMSDPDRVAADSSSADQYHQFIPGFKPDTGSQSGIEGINTMKYLNVGNITTTSSFFWREPHLFNGLDDTDLDFNTKYTYRIQINGNNAGNDSYKVTLNYIDDSNWNRSSHLIIHEIGT